MSVITVKSNIIFALYYSVSFSIQSALLAFLCKHNTCEQADLMLNYDGRKKKTPFKTSLLHAVDGQW